MNWTSTREEDCIKIEYTIVVPQPGKRFELRQYAIVKLQSLVFQSWNYIVVMCLTVVFKSVKHVSLKYRGCKREAYPYIGPGALNEGQHRTVAAEVKIWQRIFPIAPEDGGTKIRSSEATTVKQMVKTTLEPPGRRAVSTTNSIDSKPCTEMNKMQVDERNSCCSKNIRATWFRTSLEDHGFESFPVANWIDVSYIEEVSSKRNKEFMKQFCIQEIAREELYMLDQVVSKV